MARFVGYVPVHKFVLSLLSLVLVLDIMVTGSVARILTFLLRPSGLLGRAGLYVLGAGTGNPLSMALLFSCLSGNVSWPGSDWNGSISLLRSG